MKKKRATHAEEVEFHRANKLIEQREYGKAERALRRGLGAAEEQCDSNGVGFFYQALGSLYLLQGKTTEARQFYQKADNACRDYYAKLAYARLLTTIFGDHPTGLEKAKEALDLMPKGDLSASQAYSIMGLCFLGMGNQENALRAFTRSLKVYSRSTPSDSYDITLVAELIRDGVYDSRCVRYLNRILRQANREGNEHIKKISSELLARTTDVAEKDAE